MLAVVSCERYVSVAMAREPRANSPLRLSSMHIITDHVKEPVPMSYRYTARQDPKTEDARLPSVLNANCNSYSIRFSAAAAEPKRQGQGK